MNILTEQLVRRGRRLAREGLTLRQVLARLRLGKDALNALRLAIYGYRWQWLDAQEPPAARPRPITRYDHEQLLAAYRACGSYRAAAAQLGCSHTCVWQAVERERRQRRLAQ